MSAFTDLLLADAVNRGAQWIEDAKFRALQILMNLEDSGPIDEGEAYAESTCCKNVQSTLN